MEEIKAILESLVSNCLRASNAADEEEKKDEKAENGKTAKNEDVDKRDIIRQIMAIAGKEEASEDVKTIAKLAEKLAYDKSEAGTADNCNGKKAKNEKEKIEEKEEVKEEKAENKKAKNEDDEKTEEEAENKKACNSANIDKAVNDILAATNAQSVPKYETQADRLELGNKY